MKFLNYTLIKTRELDTLKEKLQNTIKKHTLIVQDYERTIQEITEADYSNKEYKIDALRTLLKDKLADYTQFKLASETWISQSMISMITRKGHMPKYATIVKYIKLLNEI